MSLRNLNLNSKYKVKKSGYEIKAYSEGKVKRKNDRLFSIGALKMFLMGVAGRGKTTFILSLIDKGGPYEGYWKPENIFFITPSTTTDEKVAKMKMPNENIFHSVDALPGLYRRICKQNNPELLGEEVDPLQKEYNLLKATIAKRPTARMTKRRKDEDKRLKELEQQLTTPSEKSVLDFFGISKLEEVAKEKTKFLIIIDDCITDLPAGAKDDIQKALENFLIRNYHLQTSIIITAQYMTGMNVQIKNNFNMCTLLPGGAAKKDIQNISRYLPCGLESQELVDMYNHYTTKPIKTEIIDGKPIELYPALTITKDAKYFQGFDHILPC